jgi:hypothetical protein
MMEDKIKNLLKTKLEERRKLNSEWTKRVGYSQMTDFSHKMDKVEAEIELLENLLKNE